MQLNFKNDNERKQFLLNYNKWEKIGEIPEINTFYYRIKLPTNASIVVAEVKNVNNINQSLFALVIQKNHTGEIPFPEPDAYLNEYDLRGVSIDFLIKYLRINRKLLNN